MMPNLSRRLMTLTLGAALITAGASSAEANAKSIAAPEQKQGISAISADFAYPMPLGDSYQTFSPSAGFKSTIRYSSSSLLGDHVDLAFTVGYQAYSVRGLTGARITQIPLYMGLETRPSSHGYWLQPYAALELGGVYSSLSFTNANNLAQNATMNFAFRVRPGLNLPLFSGISLNAEMPYEVIASSKAFSSLSAILGVRYEL